MAAVGGSGLGYKPSPELAQSLDVYVNKHWKYVAVKLAPGAQTQAVLYGDLDPLRLSFNSDRLVYPMSLSHLAKTSQHVHVWVVTAHRGRADGPRRRQDSDTGAIRRTGD